MAGQSWPVPDTGSLGTGKATQIPRAKPTGKSVWQLLSLKGEGTGSSGAK